MCLQRVGVRSVLLTDGDLQTLSNCRHTLALNGIPWDAASQASRYPPVSRTRHEG